MKSTKTSRTKWRHVQDSRRSLVHLQTIVIRIYVVLVQSLSRTVISISCRDITEMLRSYMFNVYVAIFMLPRLRNCFLFIVIFWEQKCTKILTKKYRVIQ